MTSNGRHGWIYWCGAIWALFPGLGLASPAPRLGSYVAPLSQNVTLTLDPAKSAYQGEVEFELDVRRATPVVRFHARGETLSRIRLTDSAGRDVPVRASREAEVAVLTADSPLAPGRYRLAIDFEQAYNRRAVGLYRVEFGGEPYLFSQMEAIEAREAFPCWDEPAFKIPWRITLSVPESLVALSNMPVERESRAGGVRRVEFATSPPMPSYLVAIAVGPFEHVEVSGTSAPTRIVTPRGQSRLASTAARETPALVAALERYFARPYPYAKLDLIAVPEFAYGAMENPGLITFADGILLRDPAQIGPAELESMASIIAHEAAHQWFGDLVTMEWWDDLWLNEAFADWMADKVTAEVHPELETALSEITHVDGALTSDALGSQPPIRPAGEATPQDSMGNVGAIYAKGSAVLAMTERWIGEAAFREGVNDYLTAHQWKNATGPDLWNAFGKAAKKDVASMLTTFVTQPGAPLVEVEISGAPPARRARFTQRRYVRAGDTLAPLAWRVPLGVRYRDAAGIHDWSGLLDGPSLEVALPGKGAIQWLLPNAASAGYYRWALGEQELEKLVASAANDLTPAERIGMVGNLRALLGAGKVAGDRYLAALERMLKDGDPAVLRSVVAELDRASIAPVPPAAREAYAAFVRRSAGPLARQLGFQPAAGERGSRALLRAATLRLVGTTGEDKELRAEARRLANAALNDPGAVAQSVAESVFALAAYDGDRAFWDEIRTRFETAPSPGERSRYLRALAQFADPERVRETLDYSLGDKVRPTELPRLFFELMEAHQQEAAFGWLSTHWTEVAARVPPFILPFLTATAGGCSAERWKRAEVFFADPSRRPPGIEMQLARMAERVEDCVRLLDREGATVEKWLRAR